jgi:uncharacterized protein YndB with AHSA1/START domain
MKHLGILSRAHLIIIKREGKFRWNFINPVPIQQIYERWVKKYEASWSSYLLQLKNFTESKHMDKLTTTTSLQLEIKIEAGLQTVWKSLTEEADKWWRKDFYSNPSAKQFVIEPKLGGRIYEDCGNGEGTVWYTINSIKSPNLIEMAGYIPHKNKGFSISYVKITLEEKSGSTKLILSDSVTGEIMTEAEEKECGKHYTNGWTMLIKESFKNYVESKNK